MEVYLNLATVRGSSRQDYTGPGFAQLPAVLVRAPTRFLPSRFDRTASAGSDEPSYSVVSDSSSVQQPSPGEHGTHRDRLLKALNGSRSYTSTNASLATPTQSPAVGADSPSPRDGIKRKTSYNRFIDRIFGDNRKRRNSATVIIPAPPATSTSRKKLSQSCSSGSQPRNPFRRRSSAVATGKGSPGPQRRQSAIALEGTKRIGKRALSLLGFVRSGRNSSSTQADFQNESKSVLGDQIFTAKRGSTSESADGRLDTNTMGNLNCCADRGVST